MSKKYLWNANKTMFMLGQHTPIYSDMKEESEAIHDVINAYEEYGNAFERLCAINFRIFCFNMAGTLFNLGKIYGIREERKHRKKGENDGNL